MVNTRRNYALAGATPHAGMERIRRARRWIKRYKPTDHSHRHRLRDGQRKNVRVTSYTRRS